MEVLMPTTPEGKAVSAVNATKHGILSTRLFLSDESPDEFAELQDELRLALHPEGAYELLLVERMAVTIWRQRRLIRAETAGIELRRADRNRDVTKAVEFAMSRPVSFDDYDDFAAPVDPEQAEWCRVTLDELKQIDALDEPVTTATVRQYGNVYEQIQIDAEGADIDRLYADRAAMDTFLSELQSWCRSTLRKVARQELVERLTAIARQTQAAPITDELLTRYTTALDNELVKIARELREAQAWRQKTVAEVEAT